MTHTPTLSLRENVSRMFAHIEARTLSEQGLRNYRNIIEQQLDAADRLARHTPTSNSHLFLNARMVMGFGDDNPAETLAFPKPKPRFPNVEKLVEPL